MVRKSSLLLLVICVFCELALTQGRVAIVGGTVLNVRDGSLLPGAIIVIEDDRIVSVSSGGQPPAGASLVDARGKYILPGLIDLHVHYRDWAPELYLNHGVTSVVDLGRATDWIQTQRAGIANGTIPGPRLFIAARIEGEREPRDVLMESRPIERVYIAQITGGNQFVSPDRGSHMAKNVTDAREAMRDYVSGRVKVDAIKTIHNLNMEPLRAIVEEARKANLPVIGHFENARLAADAGANGVEHTWAVAVSIVDPQAREKALQKVTKGFLPPAETFMDMQKLPDLVRYMVQREVYLNPTMRMTWAGAEALLEKGFHHEEFDLLFGDWRLRYIPLGWKLANLKEFFEIDLWHRADLTQYDRDLFEQGYKNAQRLIKTFVDAGGKLYAGTDCASMCVPGLGMHQELELLVDTGITPLQALQAATINPAELMRMEDRLGSLEEGKEGDVLILDANPLEDIRNTRKIAKVISRGRVLDGQYHADFQNPIPSDQREASSHYFPSPRIRRASLEAMTEGISGATVTVRGTGFIPYSFVLLDGQKLKTEFIDEFQLSAKVPAELLKPGTFPVTVENPDYGSVWVRGTPDLSQFRILDHVSNAFLLLVKPKTESR